MTDESAITAARAAARAFAQQQRAAISRLAEADSCPDWLWPALADAGLTRQGLPASHGGTGGGWPVLAAAVETLVAETGLVGLGSITMLHGTAALFLIETIGTRAQADDWLPEMAAGRATLSVAFSEPGAGAHPKHLSTRAQPLTGGGWRIDGRKAYVTNGPLATAFVVLAITGEADGRRQFSCLLVPRASAGVTIENPRCYPFLRPAPHCEIGLDGVIVPAEALLGLAGRGFEGIGNPFRDVEDAIGTAGLAGALDHLVRGLAGVLPADDQRDLLLGELAARAAAVAALSRLLVGGLVAGEQASPAFGARLIAARVLARDIIEHPAVTGAALPRPLAVLHHDLTQSQGIARFARETRQRRLGASLAHA